MEPPVPAISSDSELRWDLLFEQSPLSIQVFSPDGLTIRFNPAWQKLFGLTPEQAYAFNVLEAPDLIESGAVNLIRKAFEGEVVFVPPVPFPVVGRPQEIRWIGGTLYPVITPDGVLLEVVVIHHDITELKEAEETMRRLNEILEERVATRTTELRASEENLRAALDVERQLNLLKTSFVGMVSHEFRTPLGIINTAAELLNRHHDKLSAAQRAKYTGSIIGAVKRMSGMMEHILLLARIDSGKVALVLTEIDLATWLPETLAELEKSCDIRHDIQLHIDPSDALRHASLDESLLHHIVGNLFSNACKYSPPDSPVEISLLHRDAHLVLSIRDHGTGNRAPLFYGTEAATAYQTPAQILRAKILLAGWDPDGHALSVSSVVPATSEGGSVELIGNHLRYTPATGFWGRDTVTLTIRDAFGATASGPLTITVRPPANAGGPNVVAPRLTPVAGGGMQIRARAIPGFTYAIQRSTNLTDWETIATLPASPTGILLHTDPNPPQPTGFYRIHAP